MIKLNEQMTEDYAIPEMHKPNTPNRIPNLKHHFENNRLSKIVQNDKERCKMVSKKS